MGTDWDSPCPYRPASAWPPTPSVFTWKSAVFPDCSICSASLYKYLLFHSQPVQHVDLKPIVHF
jgi:hypothetical protein